MQKKNCSGIPGQNHEKNKTRKNQMRTTQPRRLARVKLRKRKALRAGLFSSFPSLSRLG
jgi:hypothetical protein